MNEQDERMLPEPPTTDQIDRMETTVMNSIRSAQPAAPTATRKTWRPRVWGGAAAAVAVVALAAVIAPGLTSSMSGSSGSSSTVEGAAVPLTGEVALEQPGQMVDGAAPESFTGAAGDAARDTVGDATAGRDVVATGWVQMTVADVTSTIAEITDLAQTEGGYVESASVGSSGAQPLEGDVSLPMSGSQVTVRVPAERLDSVIESIGGLGEVTSSTLDRTDVTDQTVDLRARIAAQQASVDRLTELMSQAGSVGDLIAAETALSERQAALDSDTQQLASLEDRVALSGVTVSLTPESAPAKADPAGFGDGLAAGWNGLIAALNGTVVALGFLLPWIALVALVGAIVWGVRRAVTRRRTREHPTASDE
ncbi:DUF4349 domain-containing protein [Microbacterium sp. cx-59]|uniref:DUF4349 domain-containing protein n=1 Tax=Microbacterium sp. cx-59 TaxID=2891207 RepID=UPI001E40646F|nr:DUF4349 domain-containing protein [Microbacterium sp. cx-59]MCC4907084.1 DUF4349 domain-containing protein [Microbacterium sp. cx-59]